MQKNTRQDFPYVFNETNDSNIQIYTTENLHTVSDLLQRSYVNDAVLNYLQFNETQQLVTDVWCLLEDTFMTTNKLSDKEYTISDQNNTEIYSYQQYLLDNNIPQENKHFTSIFELKKLKVVWKESAKTQTDIQNESNLQVIYIKDLYPNDYLIKPGDVFKDPIDPDDFWIVSQITENHIMYDKINKKNITMYTLNISRLNLTTISKTIWEYYFPDKTHFQDLETQQEKRFEITNGELPIDQPQEKEPDSGYIEETVENENLIEEVDIVKDWLLKN